MKRIWKIAGISVVIAVLGVAALGAATYAQDADNGQPFDFAAKFKEALANALGITVDEYDTAVEKAQNQVADEAVSEGWLTQDQADLLKWRMAQEPALGMRGLGKGLGGFDRGFFGGGDNLLSIAADKLGIKLTDLLTELQGGKSIATVAGEKGVDAQVIVDAYVAQVKENLDEAVTAGRITQKQADYQLQQLEQRVTDQLDNTWKGDFHGGGRHGGPMGFPGIGGL